MRKSLFLAAVALAVSSLATVVSAATIVVHNTGVDGSDTLVASGAQTSFWALSTKPLGASEPFGSTPFRYHNGAYAADTSTAAWVSPGSDGNASHNGLYTYDLVIDLTGFNPATASISGVFATDNAGSISLNGNAAVATTGFADFGSTTPFTINSGFVPGLNTIHLNVNNSDNPTAFFVSFTSATASPISVVEVPALAWPALAALALLLAGVGTRLSRKS